MDHNENIGDIGDIDDLIFKDEPYEPSDRYT